MKGNEVWSPIFTPTFREHLLWWAKKVVRTTEPIGSKPLRGAGALAPFGVRRKGTLAKTHSNRVNKILDLVEAVCEQPFKGIGKPEPIKYLDSDFWSRRINLEHRLVYRVKGDRIYFLQCRYHYD